MFPRFPIRGRQLVQQVLSEYQCFNFQVQFNLFLSIKLKIIINATIWNTYEYFMGLKKKNLWLNLYGLYVWLSIFWVASGLKKLTCQFILVNQHRKELLATLKTIKFPHWKIWLNPKNNNEIIERIWLVKLSLISTEGKTLVAEINSSPLWLPPWHVQMPL